MDITTHIAACSLIILICLGGCSGGGFEGSNNDESPVVAPNALLKRVHGVASKGIILAGNVSIFALNSNGTKGTLLKTTSTSAFGAYSSSVNLAGPTLVEVSGHYTDEATGLKSEIPQNSPLRAAVDTVSSVMTIAVTPFTELAVRKTMPLLVGGNIGEANKLVSDIFKVDIIATQPLNLSAESFAYVGTSQVQKDYTLLLAAFSQMAHDYYGGVVSDAIAAMNNDLAKGDTLGSVVSGQLKAALTKFLQSELNPTGIKDVSATNLSNAGGGTKIIKLATVGTLPPGISIYGITVAISLPPDVTVRVSDFERYQTDSHVVYSSGVFPSDIYTTGHFVPAISSSPASLTVSIPQASGSALGEFLTVVCDIPAGTTYSASDFSLPYFKVVDGNGIELQGITVDIL
ncbi:MAG: hypothetical protein J0665_04250 [Deltaproteobacteria bacterium]|nr:hypothetical protein [Deltaproteobacteria bacterium]